jgi:hypothetical protein
MMAMSLVAGATASGQTLRSTTPAERLMKLLSDRKMAHVAAADPREKGRYVAAALIGGSQLLVVSARYAQPALLNERLYRGDHEGAYVELNAASVRDGKLFVQDLGEPGLRPTRSEDGPFDIVYESGGKGTAFNGDWKAQGLSKDDYRSAFAAADEKYAHALDALLRSLAEADTGSATGAKP